MLVRLNLTRHNSVSPSCHPFRVVWPLVHTCVLLAMVASSRIATLGLAQASPHVSRVSRAHNVRYRLVSTRHLSLCAI
jgi:hypothetical protein